MQFTYRYRIKDKHAKRLKAQARAVNLVWNYCNETQMKAARDGRGSVAGAPRQRLCSTSRGRPSAGERAHADGIVPRPAR
jgi:putative transposase